MSGAGSEIFFPLRPRPSEDPLAAGVVQANLEYVMQLFEKGLKDGDVLTWDATVGRWVAKGAGGITVVTALPIVDIFDGREIILVDSISSPTFNWHLRYNAASGSSYKWECIGATPGFAVATGDENDLTNTGYADTANGPTFTLPTGVGGDFFITLTGCVTISSDAGGGLDIDRAQYSYRIGSGAASDVWAIRSELGADALAVEGGVTGHQSYRHTGIASGAAIICQDKQSGGSHHHILGARTLTVTPIRVG